MSPPQDDSPPPPVAAPTLRQRTAQLFEARTPQAMGLWLVAPVLCAVIPGKGALLAFAWVIAVMAFARQPASTLGLGRPASWWKTLALALALALFILIVSGTVLEPLARWVTGRPLDMSRLQNFQGNTEQFLKLLALSWAVGGFVEEVLFRGFLIGFAARLFGDRWQWPLALVSSALFGWSHLYQGITGVLLTGMSGMILASVYLISRRNLPLTMVAHGLVDTLSIIALYTGHAK